MSSRFVAQKIGKTRSIDLGQIPNTRVTQEQWDDLRAMKERTAASALTAQQPGLVLRPPVQAKVVLPDVPQNYTWQTASEPAKEATCKLCLKAGVQHGAINMSLVTIFLSKIVGWCKVEAGGQVWSVKRFLPNGASFCAITILSQDKETTIRFTLAELAKDLRSVS